MCVCVCVVIGSLFLSIFGQDHHCLQARFSHQMAAAFRVQQQPQQPQPQQQQQQRQRMRPWKDKRIVLIVSIVGLLVLFVLVREQPALSSVTAYHNAQNNTPVRALRYTPPSSSSSQPPPQQAVHGNDNDKDNKQLQAVAARWQRYRETYQYHKPKPRHDNNNNNNDDESSSSTKQQQQQQQRQRSKLCGKAPNYDKFFARSFKERSRFREDEVVYNLFFKDNNKTKEEEEEEEKDDDVSFYLEIGAFDGIRESNTRFFDECLGWDGLLIEPNPKVYPHLVKSRPFAHRMSFAPSCSGKDNNNETIGFYDIPYTSAMQDGIVENPQQKPRVRVPCGSLTSVLQDVVVPPQNKKKKSKRVVVRFFSLDVEGAERHILDHLDLHSITIEILLVESENRLCPADGPCPNREYVRTLLQERYGYKLYQNLVVASDVFVHPRIASQHTHLPDVDPLTQEPQPQPKQETKPTDKETSSSTTTTTTGVASTSDATPKKTTVPITTKKKTRPSNKKHVKTTTMSTSTTKKDGRRIPSIAHLVNPRGEQYMEQYKYNAPLPRDGYNTTLCGQGPDYKTFFALSLMDHSRLQEDELIYNLFFRNTTSTSTRGVYVEMGGFNGVQESNSRFFDECLHWDGLLIEPNPLTYPALVQNRPHAHRMSFAPSCKGAPVGNETKRRQQETVAFHAISFTSATQEGVAGAEEDHPTNHVEVPCGPLTPVLLDLFPKPRVINFFSLDVEGAETMILKTLDLDAITIEVMIAESFNRMCRERCEARQQVRRIMVRNGYRWYPDVIPASDLFLHPSLQTRLPTKYQMGLLS